MAKVNLVVSANDLPDRVKRWLWEDEQDDLCPKLLFAVKTKYRDNSNMPYAWLVVTTGRVALYSTHRRGVHWVSPLKDINSVRRNGSVIEILSKDMERDVAVPVGNLSTDGQQNLFDRLSAIVS